MRKASESLPPVRASSFLPKPLIRLSGQIIDGIKEPDRQYTRYFTLTHLYNAGVSDDALHAYSLALSKLLNSLSWQKRIAVPQPVDAAQTILRIDIRHYSWTADTWRKLVTLYPYAVVAQTAVGQSVRAATDCEMLCARADWFVARAGQPLLYHALLGLPRTVFELEAKLGIDANRNIRQGNARRAGFGESGVSRNNRIVERHDAAFGAYWRSYDFSSSVGKQNIFQNPIFFDVAGGEIIFNLPNGLQGYMLVNSNGERINAGPVEIVTNKENASDPVVRNGLTCMTCHTQGLRRFQDQVRAVIEKTPTPDYDRDRALGLYVEPSRLAALMEGDNKRYAAGIHATGAEIGSAEPIVALATKYDAPLNLMQAAAEMGVSPELLQARLQDNASLAPLLAVLQTPGGQIKRDAWEQAQEEVTARLALGVYLAPHITVSKNGEGQFASITEAIRNVPAGTRIFIDPGIYKESLVLDKSVELTSNNPAGEVRIEATGSPCVFVQEADVTLRGIILRVQGAPAGKPVPAAGITSGRLTLFNCALSSETGAGLIASGEKTDVFATKCWVHDCKEEGVLVIAHARAQFEDCDLSGSPSANVLARASGSILLRRCKIHDGAHQGITATQEGQIVAENCDIGKNGEKGANIVDGGKLTLYRCQVLNNQENGVWLGMNSTGSLQDCILVGNVSAGVGVGDNATATILRCRAQNNQHHGIWIGRGGYGIVRDCDIGTNGWTGVSVIDGGKGEFYHCQVFNNKEDGVKIGANSVCSLQDCFVFGNAAVGISVSDKANGTIQRCQAHHNTRDGIWIGSGGHATVEKSPLYSNGGAGIALHSGRAELRDCTLNGNQLAGILADDQSVAEAWRCDLTRNTQGAYKVQSGSTLSGGANKQ